jgi:fumarate reductase subunit D
MTRRPTHALPWLLFSAGGVMSALFLPSLLFASGLVSPPSYAAIRGVVVYPLTRWVLFFVVMLSLLHFAHRFRYTLYDALQIKRHRNVVAVLCYGSAVAGTTVAAVVLAQLA